MLFPAFRLNYDIGIIAERLCLQAQCRGIVLRLRVKREARVIKLRLMLILANALDKTYVILANQFVKMILFFARAG